MAISPRDYEERYKNLSVKDLEILLSSLQDKEEIINSYIRNYTHSGARTSNKNEERVIVDLLNKKTNSTNYSTIDNIVITTDDIIKHIINPNDSFWIIVIKRFLDNLSRKIPDIKESEKVDFLVALYQNKENFNNFTKELTSDYNCIEIYNKYKEIANEYCMRNNKR